MTTDEQVTVFTASGCMQCRMTARALEQAGIAFVLVDITDKPDVADQLREAGFQQLPVVRAPGHATWSGFRPDKITELETAA
ncbi:glutaredoxin-like protein NrdH [Microbacterium karelineae]|uniref:glutaredoxin-like protein NrdH n=1 Tax=Microbacterium karelineae TaxID=2654283 RepID=UPI0012E99C63|nr:glutaredoxin-like protein NrdH [Microbacterium karelineae]